MLPCPRRAESPYAVTPPESDRWHDDQTCSYCGSLSPEEFLRAVEAGAQVFPTDKNYKAYIDVPNPEAGKLVLAGSHYNPDPSTAARYANDPTWRKTEDNRWERWQPAGERRNAKFYFQHFTVEQRKQFIDLLNAGKVKLGEPGRFYVLPFFIRPVG